MPERLSQPRIETLPDILQMEPPASSSCPPSGPSSSNADIDELLDEGTLLATVQGQRNMYDTFSMLETPALLKEMENRSTPPVTPTPSRRLRAKNDGSSPLTQLELPTCLRMNPTPSKKAPQEIRNAMGARKNRLKKELEDRTSSAGSSRGSSQSQVVIVPPSVPAIGVSLYLSENETTPTGAQSAVPQTGHKTSQLDAAAPRVPRTADTLSMSSWAASTATAASGIQSMLPDLESISTYTPSNASLHTPTLQQQLFLVQDQVQGLQREMQTLIQKQTMLPDPNDAQKMYTLQQQILHAQSQFQALLLGFGPTSMAKAPLVLSTTARTDVSRPPDVALPMSVVPASMLDNMGFEEVPLPIGPSGSSVKSANRKRTMKAKSTKPLKSQKNPAEEAFSKMGNNNTQSIGFDEDVLKQPSPQTGEQSVSAVPTSLSPPCTSIPTISAMVSGEGTHTTPDPSFSLTPAIFSARSALAAPKPQRVVNNVTAPPVTLSVDASMNDSNADPLLQALFPGLPAFTPTDLTFADMNINPDDLIPYPEELQDMLQAEELLVDKRGGRPSSQTLAAVDGELAVMDTKLAELSKKTGISVTNILKRWNTTKTRGGSLWNIYQKYFTSNKADELARLGLDSTTKVTGLVRSQAYVAFRKAYPEAWPEVLEVWAQYAELENNGKSAQQRALAFRWTWRTICGIGESVQRRHGFSLAAVMAGNEIHHDHSLVDVYEAKDAKGFFEQKCRADHDKLKGHFKAHIYNVTSKNIVAHDFNEEAVIKEEDTHVDLTDHAERTNGRGDLIIEVKQALTKAASKAGLVLNVGNLPWAKLLQVCADNNIYIDNYPASVQRPSGPEKGGHSKGIGNIIKQERLDLMKAINALKNALKFVKIKNAGDIKDNTHPVLVYAPPLPGSTDAFSERVFLDGTVDHNGHPRMAGKGSTNVSTTLRKSQRQKPRKRKAAASTASGDEVSSSEALSSDSETLDDGPARRTRSHTSKGKKQARFIEVESEDEDNGMDKEREGKDQRMQVKGKEKERPERAVTSLQGPQAQGPSVPAKHVPVDIEDAPGPSKKSRTEPEPVTTNAFPAAIAAASLPTLPMPSCRTLTELTARPEVEHRPQQTRGITPAADIQMPFNLNPWTVGAPTVAHFPGLMPFGSMSIQPTPVQSNAGIPSSLAHLPMNADMMNVLQMQNMAAMFPGMSQFFGPMGPHSGMGNDGHQGN